MAELSNIINQVVKSIGSKKYKITDVHQSENTVSWKIICSGKNGSMEGTGKITYLGDSLEGFMDMVIKGANMKIKNKMKGHRIGECTSEQKNNKKH